MILNLGRFNNPELIAKKEIKQGNFDNVQVYDNNGELQVNGVPLTKKIQVEGTTVLAFMPVTLGGVDLGAPSLSISGSKKVVKTELAAGEGQVIELINKSNYQIDIEGKIVGENGVYPAATVQELVELYERNEAIDIINALTSFMLPAGAKVVITSLSLPTVEGYEEVQLYTLTLESDTDLSLYL